MAWALLFLCFALRHAGASAGRPSKVDARIVGGYRTTIAAYPFMVDIHKNNRHHCGGTLLSQDTVLTASHCVYNRRTFESQKRYELYSPHKLRVVLGTTYSLRQMLKPSGPTVRDVSFIHAHPEFRFHNMQDDIAILKLSRPVNLTSDIQLVNLLSHDPPPGTICTALGWGISRQFDAQEPIRGNFEDQLHVVDLPIIPLYECRKSIPVVNDQHLCTYAPSKDACLGDSGGPLMCNGKQAGITSFGRGCAAPGYPGVFQKVYIHKSWSPVLSRSLGRGRAVPGPRPRARRNVLPAVLLAMAALPLPLPA